VADDCIIGCSSVFTAAHEKPEDTYDRIEMYKKISKVADNCGAKYIRLLPDCLLEQDKLIAQLYSPVLWVASVNTMAAAGITSLVECGPGKVLCGMSKRIVRGMNVSTLQDQAGFDATLAALTE